MEVIDTPEAKDLGGCVDTWCSKIEVKKLFYFNYSSYFPSTKKPAGDTINLIVSKCDNNSVSLMETQRPVAHSWI